MTKNVSQRIWHDTLVDHKVEAWKRHDGKFYVTRLERWSPGRRWRETDKIVVDTIEEVQTWTASFTKGWTR